MRNLHSLRRTINTVKRNKYDDLDEETLSNRDLMKDLNHILTLLNNEIDIDNNTWVLIAANICSNNLRILERDI